MIDKPARSYCHWDAVHRVLDAAHLLKEEGGHVLPTLICLAKHSDHEDVAWPSVETIASSMALSQKTVRRHLQALESLGWIAPRGKGKNGVSRWKLTLPQTTPDKLTRDNMSEALVNLSKIFEASSP